MRWMSITFYYNTHCHIISCMDNAISYSYIARLFSRSELSLIGIFTSHTRPLTYNQLVSHNLTILAASGHSLLAIQVFATST